ncbi:hypothetical protein OROGR_033113 [Orobanche gracilis]
MQMSEEAGENLPLALPGHLYTVSTADLITACRIYSGCFKEGPNKEIRETKWQSSSSCKAFITYRVRSTYANLGSISDLCGKSRMEIATATNLTSDNIRGCSTASKSALTDTNHLYF